MEEEKLRELEAAQAETERKLAAAQRATDRAAELETASEAHLLDLRKYLEGGWLGTS